MKSAKYGPGQYKQESMSFEKDLAGASSEGHGCVLRQGLLAGVLSRNHGYEF